MRRLSLTRIISVFVVALWSRSWTLKGWLLRVSTRPHMHVFEIWNYFIWFNPIEFWFTVPYRMSSGISFFRNWGGVLRSERTIWGINLRGVTERSKWMVLNFWSVPKYNNYQKPKIIPCYTNHMSNKLLKLFNVWSNDIFFFQFFQTCMHLLILALWVQTFFFLRYFRNVSLYHFVRNFLYFYHFLNRHFGTWKVIPRVTLRF